MEEFWRRHGAELSDALMENNLDDVLDKLVLGDSDPNLSDKVREGSFNPYGNGQPTVNFLDRQCPESDLESVDHHEFGGMLATSCRSLPMSACNLAQNIINREDYPLLEHPDGFCSKDLLLEVTEGLSGTRKSVGSEKDISGKKVDLATKKANFDSRKKFDLAQKLNNVVRRVCGRMTDWSNVLIWLTHGDTPDKHLAQLLVAACVRKNLPDSSGVCASLCRQVSEGVREKELLIGCGSYCPELHYLQQSKRYQEWLRVRFSTDNMSRVLIDSDSLSTTGFVNSVRGDSLVGPGFEMDEEEEDHVRLDPAEGKFLEFIEAKEEPESVDGHAEAEALNRNKKMHSLKGNIDGYDEYLARVRNQLMHAQNGNTSSANFEFPDSMTDIEAANVSVRSLVETEGTLAGPLNDPLEDVVQQTGLLNIQGVTMSSVPREIHLRGAVISAANAVNTRNTLNSPEALLYPSSVRNVATGVLQNNTIRPAIYGVGLVRRHVKYPCRLSASGLLLAEMLASMGNIRPDQITSKGFLTVDSAALTRLAPDDNGDSIAPLLLKSYLYEKTRSWLNDPAQLPLGGEPGKFDSYSALAANPVVTLGYNSSAVFNATNLVGGSYRFPYGNVLSGIAFHVCKTTVPNNEPFFMVPPGLFVQSDSGQNSGLNLALLAMLLAPYPCGIHSVGMSTVDGAGGNAGIQTFIPGSDLVYIPGITTTIHLILPLAFPAGPPATAGAAANQAFSRPYSGPTAVVGGLAANQALTISSINAGVIAITVYGLGDYLYTWMALPNSPVDITTLARFRRSIVELTHRQADLDLAWELSCVLSVRYPAMVVSDVNAVTEFPTGTASSYYSQNFFGLRPTMMTENYPAFTTGDFDFYLADMNPIWWCKVVSGVFDSTPDMTARLPVRCYDGGVRTLQYSIHAVREYAITAEHIFTYMQMPVGVWNAAFAQLNFVSILGQIRGFFCEANSGGGDAMYSENGFAAALLHCRVNGHRPAADMFDNTIWDIINSPVTGFLPVIDEGGTQYTNITPCVLADVWVQLNMKTKTLSFTPLLSPNKMLTGVQVTDGQVTPIGGGGYLSPMTRDSQPRAIGIDTVPVLDDATLFNARLTWHAFTSSIFDLIGGLAASVPLSNQVVVQRPLLADWTMDNLLPASILTANTRWIPYMDVNGLRLSVGVTAANNAALMTTVMAKRSYTGVATWLLRGARAVPNTIVTAGGSNTVSRIVKRRPVGNASPLSGPPPEGGGGTEGI